MKIYRDIGLNFGSTLWSGILIVVTTPVYVSLLGFEKFGLVGFWQVLLSLSLICDFGVGAALIRELARYRGEKRHRADYLKIMHSAERLCLVVAVIIGVSIFYFAPVLATKWLRLVALPTEIAQTAIGWMSLSLAAQLIGGVYLNGLAGMHRHLPMNSIQIFGYTLRYVGGSAVLAAGYDLDVFFAYQGLCLAGLAFVARGCLCAAIVSEVPTDGDAPAIAKGRFWTFSMSMFATAAVGTVLTNADRILISKLSTAEDLGRYSVALTAAGFIQMVVLAFYRVYYPVFAELSASGDSLRLKRTYQSACEIVGTIVAPASAFGWSFAPELVLIWLGRTDPTTAQLLRWLIVGSALAGLMWLPAAYQQACGWPALHIWLMAVALIMGFPLAAILVQKVGVLGGAAIMLTHGLVEITLGLVLMYRAYFPTEILQWYTKVVVKPLAVALPIIILVRHWMPDETDRLRVGLWVSFAFMIAVVGILIQNRNVLQRPRVS